MIWTCYWFENYGDRSWLPEINHYVEEGWHNLDIGWFKWGFGLRWKRA